MLLLQIRCKSKVFFKGIKDYKDYRDNRDDRDYKEGGLDFQNSRLLDSIENATKKHKNAHTLAYVKKK